MGVIIIIVIEFCTSLHEKPWFFYPICQINEFLFVVVVFSYQVVFGVSQKWNIRVNIFRQYREYACNKVVVFFPFSFSIIFSSLILRRSNTRCNETCS